MPRGHVWPDGHRIACLRGEADLTQIELARAAGYGLRTIGKIEAGKPTSAGTLAAIAEVLGQTLQRNCPPADLLRRNGTAEVTHSEGTGMVEEVVQMLDLHPARPPACSCPTRPNRAVLLDHYRFRNLPAGQPALTFYYATTGRAIEAKCVSHPTAAKWQETTAQTAADPAPNRWRHSYQMNVQVEKAATKPTVIETRLEYVDAFQTQDREWFRTHVLFPTDSLSVVVRFPPHKPGRQLRGKWQHHPTGLFQDTRTQPVPASDGQVAYWRVPAPCLGATYQLEWQW